MRVLFIIVAAASIVGATPKQPTAQQTPSFMFYRICNIKPGYKNAALATAQQMVDLTRKKYPSAQMTAEQGRWMTGFQEIAQPADQILFAEQHRTLSDYHDFTATLQADEDFRLLQRGISEAVDIDTCVNTQFRAVP